MPEIKENELKEQIKTGNFSRLYFICGEEDYMKKVYVERLLKAIVPPEFEAFNLHTLEGNETNVDTIAECVEAMPMMSEYVCVLVKDFRIDELNETEKKKFEELISDLPDTTVLIFWMYSIEVNPKGTKWKSPVTKMSKVGDIVNFSRLTQSDLAKLLISGAKKRKCELDRVCANYLVETVGEDLNSLLNELEKICFYINEGVINKEVIDKLATKSVEASAFDLVNAIVARKSKTAMSILNSLFALKTDPIMIMGAIISTYVDMYRTKVTGVCGKHIYSLSDYFSYGKSTFRLDKATRFSSRLSIEQLRKCLDELMIADQGLKSTATDKRFLVEKCVVKLIMISGE
ncbi:MAG: DNA polymerase III subunit delta [Clostridiales bacterium]|nr:DNA polymerase III subunit delta [Clostridiales bacterium]